MIKISQKNRKMIPLAIIMVAVVIMGVSIKNTAQLSLRYFALQRNLNSHNSNIYSIDDRKMQEAEKLVMNSNYEKIIFEALGDVCQANHVLIKQVELVKFDKLPAALIQSQHILVQGDFVNILKALNDVTLKLETVKIASVKFSKEEKNKKIDLVADIVFQSVKLSKSDDN